MYRIFGLLCVSLLATGCATLLKGPDITIDSAELTPLSPDLIRAENARAERRVARHHPLPNSSKTEAYRIGVGDVLSVTVWDHPELTIPAGPERTALESGQRVQADGTIFYPYVGKIRAKGMTVSVLRERLAKALSEYIPEPQLDISIAQFNSKSVLITGSVANPQILPLDDQALDLVSALNVVGGALEEGDLAQVTIQRNQDVFTVDVDRLVENGVGENPVLRDGDIVNVPKFEFNYVYLLGAVNSQGRVKLDESTATLLDAISVSEGFSHDEAFVQRVFLIRRSAHDISYFSVDFSDANQVVMSAELLLQPNDIVYVSKRSATNWNMLLSDILPSMQFIQLSKSITE